MDWKLTCEPQGIRDDDGNYVIFNRICVDVQLRDPARERVGQRIHDRRKSRTHNGQSEYVFSTWSEERETELAKAAESD